MNTEIQSFISMYAEAFSEHGRAYSREFGAALSDVLSHAASRPKSAIYIFGNGGSHAIARCFRHSIISKNYRLNLPQRVVATVDPDSYSIGRETPGPDFKSLLIEDGANDNDLVILISGSGNSSNLIEVGLEAKKRGMHLIALVGRKKCALASVVSKDSIYPVEFGDQQVGEDIIQYLSCLAGAGQSSTSDYSEEFLSQSERISALPSHLIVAMVESLERSFRLKERVRVLGLGHPALAACAEHTAHNLNWDAFYEVNAVPDVNIISSPSLCDYSGISNDRRHGFLRHFSKIYPDTTDNSTTIIYSYSGVDPKLVEYGVNDQNSKNTFLFCGVEPPKKYQGNQYYCSNTKDPLSHAALAQSLGHILGRTLRLKLLETRSAPNEFSLSQPVVDFLMQSDLAQRRLLD